MKNIALSLLGLDQDSSGRGSANAWADFDAAVARKYPDWTARRISHGAYIIRKGSRERILKPFYDHGKVRMQGADLPDIAPSVPPVVTPAAPQAHAKATKKKAAYAATAQDIKLIRALRDWHHLEHKQSTSKEDVEAAKDAGSAERDATARTSSSGSFVGSFVGADGVVPNEIFRASVVQRAVKSAFSRGAKAPETKDFYRANSSVKSDLERNGLRVGIPGGRPGRVTR